MYAFNYVKPGSLAEARQALSAPEAKALGGGQSLIPTLKLRLAQPSALVDVKALPELKGAHVDGDSILIGAAATHEEVASLSDVRNSIPGLAHLASGIGDPHVRRRGTMGGSLANNDPSACYPAAVLGLGATVVTDKREIAADEFFKGLFETALDETEIITGVRFPIPQRSAYAKFRQPASRFALTAVFVSQGAGGVRVAVTGASENGVHRNAAMEQALSANFSPDALDGVTVSASGMISDLHGAPEYRANLVKVMAKRAVQAALG